MNLYEHNRQIDDWRWRAPSNTHDWIVSIDGSDAEKFPVLPRAEDLVWCKEVLDAGERLLGERWEQFFWECQGGASGASGAAVRNRVLRGRAEMRAWRERAS